MRVCITLAVLSLAACTNTYHPEYHPVTATTITQTTSSGSQPTTVAAPGLGPVIVQQPPAANPDQFFDTPQR